MIQVSVLIDERENISHTLQTWALAFRHDPDLKHVEQFYQECKEQGLQFPPPDPENIIKAAVPPTVSLSLKSNMSANVVQGTMDRPLQQTRSTVGSTERDMHCLTL